MATPVITNTTSSRGQNPPTSCDCTSNSNDNHHLTMTVAENDVSVSHHSRRSYLPQSHSSATDWGWFDDGHDHAEFQKGSNDSKPGTERSAVANYPSSNNSTPVNGEGGPGLLHFDTFVSVIDDIVGVVDRNDETAAMAVTAPTYVLEESRSNQRLWKETAGNRPPQPVEDRAYFERMWSENFARSQVKYDMPVEVLTASSPICLSPFADGTFNEDDEIVGGCSNYNLAAPFNSTIPRHISNRKPPNGSSPRVHTSNHPESDPAWVREAEANAAEVTLMRGIIKSAGFDKRKNYNSLKSMGPLHHHHTLVNKKVKGSNSNEDLTVMVKGDNVFGTTVSKSFSRVDNQVARGVIDTVSISIVSYRVVESKKHGKYAQFLIVYCEGSFRDTIGVWKRFSDFEELAKKVTASVDCHPLTVVTEDNFEEHLPNAMTSWRLLKKRQRWYRCLDAGYLSLKVFLLERFLHDILFESSSPGILRDFVGGDEASLVGIKSQ